MKRTSWPGTTSIEAAARGSRRIEGRCGFVGEAAGRQNAVAAYNRFWMDPGQGYATVKGEYRSSWITFPPDGRIPYSEARHVREHADELV